MSGAPGVTIAGAGVLGLASALALADAGCAVTVADPGGPNASGIAAGMVAPAFEAVLDPLARPHFDLLMAARDLWPGLAARAGVALDRSGAMAVGPDEWLATVAAGFAALRLRPTEIGGATARRLSPALSQRFGRALLTREDWRVEAPSALEALRGAATAAGVVFRRGRVTDAEPGSLLVIATGADMGLAGLAPELSALRPIKGHIARAAAATQGVTVRSRGVYVVPGQRTVLGATMEEGVADAAVEAGKAATVVAAGQALFPGLEGAPLEIAAGVRAAAPDGLPLVGPSVAPGVVLAVGSRRNGWLLAPLVAQVVTACVLGRVSGPYAARFDPARVRG